MAKFISPLYIRIAKSEKGKKYQLNLNEYRNWHYQVNNSIKKKYCEQMKTQLEGVKLKTPIRLNFTLWRKDKRVGDRANVLAVVEKFFCDALKEYGCIEDDNDGFIAGETYATGGIDRDNPRVDIEIIESS